MAIFGQIIREEREKRGWTQTAFGARIGINATAISRIENGYQKFSRNKLTALSDIFGLEIQRVKDLFYADKFASEAYKNNCSDQVFVAAEDTVKYLKTVRTDQ